MPALSFTCQSNDKIYLEQVLPALLDKSKTQTIRPLEETYYSKMAICDDEMCCPHGKEYKKPRLKVGDIVTLYWKQRTSRKGTWFCEHCGNGVDYPKDRFRKDGTPMPPFMGSTHCGTCDGMIGLRTSGGQGKNVWLFPKRLGQVKITEVFQIEMHYKQITNGCETATALIVNGIDKVLSFSERNIELPHRDGFKDFSSFWEYFRKKYDLSHSRKFAVYRW